MTLQQVKLWGPFACASCLTILASKTLWSTSSYYTYLSLLGVMSVLLAARLLFQTGTKVWPMAGVVTGLLVGQWWFVQSLINRLFFRFSGFAP
jgi:hypothetical protein